MLSVISRKFIT